MGQISLKQNQGARPTDLPAGISDTTAYAIHGMNAIDRANDRLAAGMKHVSDTLFGVSKDMAETRNRVEADTAQIEIFKLEDADNRKLEADIVAGKIKTPEQFQEAYNSLYASRETKIDKYLEDNVCSSRNAEFLKLDAKKKSAANFAHMSGVYIRYENERIWNATQDLVKQGIDSGNYDIGKKAIGDFCVGKSEELASRMYWQYDYDFCRGQMNRAKTAIGGATTPEQIDEIISQVQSEGYDLGVYEKDRVEFNIFASIHKDRLERAEDAEIANAIRTEKSAIKEQKQLGEVSVNEKVKATKTNVSDAIRTATEMGEKISDIVDFDGAEKGIEKLCAEKGISKEKATAILGDFRNFCRDQRNSIADGVNRNMYAQAVNAVKDAYEKNDGHFDLNVISGGNAKTAETLGQAREKIRDWTERYEGLTDKYKAGTLSNEEKAEYESYRADYFKQLTSILKYDKDIDPRGEKLASICVEIDKYDAASRKELLGALYSKVVKNKDFPVEWSGSDIKQFDDSFADLCEFNRGLWFTFGKTDENDPILYTKMRNRVLNLARLRNMSTTEAIEELRKDPFARNIILKKSRAKAVEFTNL